jgi:ribosomal protein S18 acetylase RimI-like enzyme
MLTIYLPDAPDIAGLRFRLIRGAEDAEALLAVHTGRAARDGVDPLSISERPPSLDSLRETLTKAVGAEQQDRWLVAQIGERVIGYSRIRDWLEADGTRVYLTLGWVLPEWRGKGIGTAMLHWAEERIRRLAAADHPGEKAEFAGNASSAEADSTALLLQEGYRAAYTVLEMDLPASALIADVALPPGIETRPVLSEHLLPIAECVDEAFRNEYEGGRYNDPSDPAAYAAELADPKLGSALWQVAWEGDQIVGVVLARVVENGQADIFEVGVRPAWRRRGIARGLLLRALQALRTQGVQVIRLFTNENFRTRAMDLYQSSGFRIVKRFPRYRKPLNG